MGRGCGTGGSGDRTEVSRQAPAHETERPRIVSAEGSGINGGKTGRDPLPEPIVIRDECLGERRLVMAAGSGLGADVDSVPESPEVGVE